MLPQKEKALSLIVSTDKGGEATFPAVLRATSDSLFYDQIDLLGTLANHVDAHRVSWAQRAIRSVPVEPSQVTYTAEGTLRSSGRSIYGPGVDSGTIYPIAEIQLHSLTERNVLQESHGTYAAMYLWPPPPDWPRSYRQEDEYIGSRSNRYGQSWRKEGASQLEFRLASSRFEREIPSFTIGSDTFWVPVVYMRPVAGRSNMTEDEFEKRSHLLWRSLKTALSFFFRTELATFRKVTLSEKMLTTKTWARRLDLRRMAQEWDRQSWERMANDFCQKFVSATARHALDSELLHASTLNYLQGLQAATLEVQLLSFVEGTERVLELFEAMSALDRQLWSRAFQRRYRQALKAGLQSDKFGRAEKSLVLKATAQVPLITLEDRIVRMINKYVRFFAPYERQLFDDLGPLIVLRNAIVHGRKVGDYDLLIREKLRAKLLLEKLFVCLTGNKGLCVSNEHVPFINGTYVGGGTITLGDF